MSGGTGTVAVRLLSDLDAVADVTVVHSGNVNASNQAFTLTSYVFGPRFTLRFRGRFNLFVEGLAGGVHAGGLGYGTSTQSASAFALAAGGGVDVRVSPRIALHVVQADYYLTHLPNGINAEENNLRLSFGVVFRFGHR